MTIWTTIGQYAGAVFAGFKPTTKPASEFLQFLEAFPFGQVLAAALVEGTNPMLDATAAAAIVTDIVNSFFASKTIPAAAVSTALKVGVSPSVLSRGAFTPDPVHPAFPGQFSLGR